MTHIFHAVTFCPSVDVVEAEECLLCASFGVYKVTFFYIGIYQFLTPPCKIHVFWLHVIKVVAAIIQVFKGE